MTNRAPRSVRCSPEVSHHDAPPAVRTAGRSDRAAAGGVAAEPPHLTRPSPWRRRWWSIVWIMEEAPPGIDFEETKRILVALEREDVRYVLIGAMGMAAQGLVRATHDLDFFVAPEPENVDRLKKALKSLFDNDPNVDEISAKDLAGDYPAIEYTPPHGRYSVDILSRLGEAFSFSDVEAESEILTTAEGNQISVATPRMLYRMKRDTVRPQDRLDAEVIKREFKLEED
jgi:hypothetical protein